MDPAPVSDFAAIVASENSFYIDKTEFIKDFIYNQEVSVILRPRGFGKSTNLSMLHSFFSIHSEVDSFENFIIGKDQDFCKTHFKKYPVVKINFKEVEGENWEEMKRSLWRVLSGVVQHHLEKDELKSFIDINFKSQIPPDDFEDVIQLLTEALDYKYGESVIVLIDDYDAPQMKALKNGYFEEASSFLNTLYSSTLKDNRALYGACLMGTMDVRKMGIYSGPNNFDIYSVIKKRHSKHFGFVEEEVAPFCKNNELKDVLSWYGGYRMWNYRMVNPRSFATWLRDGKLDSHWIESSSVEALELELTPHLKKIFVESCAFSFIDGYEMYVHDFTPQISYDGSNLTVKTVWNLLIQAGYLSFIPGEDKAMTCLKTGSAVVPNYELSRFWKNHLLPVIVQKTVPEEISKALVKALGSFDVEQLPGIICDLSSLASDYVSTWKNAHHMLVHSLCFGVCNLDDNFSVSSKHDAGDDSYNLVIKSSREKKNIIFEFKKSSSDDLLEIAAEAGLNQIIGKNCMVEYPDSTFLLIGVSIFGKHMSSLKHQIHPALSEQDPTAL